MKNVGKFVWRVTKNLMGSVTCVALVGASGYYISLGLNWITKVVIDFITAATKYLIGNWVAVIVVIIALTIGSLIFERIMNSIKNRKNRKNQA